MYIDLWGNIREDKRDMAMKIIRESLNDPFYQIVVDDKGDLHYLDSNGSQVSLDIPGLYAIYFKNACLYVGQTTVSISKRSYRFIKELEGRSRHDESHPGANRARRAGLKFQPGFQIKIYTKANGISIEDIDEYIAPLLKSKFNKKVRK